jgi:pilus assembly protein Flp/PilA
MLITLYQRLRLDERGASMVEYALLVTLIALVALVAVALAGTELSTTYSEIASDLEYAGA